MFYYIFFGWLSESVSVFHVFKYISVRSAGAAITSLLISLILAPVMIRWLYMMKIGQEIRRDECPPLHLLHKNKEGVPTMGGLLILLSVCISTLLWAQFSLYTFLALGVFVALGLLGLADDYTKVKQKNAAGISGKTKLVVQSLVALAAALILLLFSKESFPFYVPFLKNPVIENLGYYYIILAVLVIVGTSNAVNLTDGLDGLAIGTVTIAAMSYLILAYCAGNVTIANYLNIYYAREAAELTVFLAAIGGAGLGFLWYNAHPAMVFMGDTGSLALGGAIGITALLVRKEVLLLIIGFIFVMEAFSDILQVASFKVRHKRIFRMAPIHHHFEIQGWPETRVTARFLILALIFAIIGLATLKLQ
ncbi:phospho-N-acetylmuramoyl-pentapeptide-transferase [bacterium]|nr:phospho-N-acetylmuramoyl-pentapeptide-transferase [bacterium]